MTVHTTSSIPDITTTSQAATTGTLKWVGMDGIHLPLLLTGLDSSAPTRVEAIAEILVDLKEPEARGIHMSRLFLLLNQLTDVALDAKSIEHFLEQILESHSTLSTQAALNLSFSALIKRPALTSDLFGWKSYPTKIKCIKNTDHFHIDLEIGILYSSTCPCSAALARQSVAKAFAADFSQINLIDKNTVIEWLHSERGTHATPHGQRSQALIKIRLDPNVSVFPTIDLINIVERAVATPVQTAVKRQDEQAFAELNGQNLMFCEDAARRIQSAFTTWKNAPFSKFKVR
ncbi:MAG: GTP cyclohydrolase FolE2, partial [Pseudomonadota bacterium]